MIKLQHVKSHSGGLSPRSRLTHSDGAAPLERAERTATFSAAILDDGETLSVLKEARKTQTVKWS